MEQVHYIQELQGHAGIAAPLSLAGRPFTPGKKACVHILALGDVGMTMLIGLRLLGAADIACNGICDLTENNQRPLEKEITQKRNPFAGQGDGPVLPPVYMVTEEQLFDCDVSSFVPVKAYRPFQQRETYAWPSWKPTKASSAILPGWPVRRHTAVWFVSFPIP